MNGIVSEVLKTLLSSDTPKNKPTRRVDPTETELGTMSEDLQRIWAIHESLRQELEAKQDGMQDIATCIKAEIAEKRGDIGMPRAEEFIDQLRKCQDSMKSLARRQLIIERIYHVLLRAEFQKHPAEKPFLGVRKDFVVVCRSNDNRKDAVPQLDRTVALIQHMKQFLSAYQVIVISDAWKKFGDEHAN